MARATGYAPSTIHRMWQCLFPAAPPQRDLQALGGRVGRGQAARHRRAVHGPDAAGPGPSRPPRSRRFSRELRPWAAPLLTVVPLRSARSRTGTCIYKREWPRFARLRRPRHRHCSAKPGAHFRLGRRSTSASTIPLSTSDIAPPTQKTGDASGIRDWFATSQRAAEAISRPSASDGLTCRSPAGLVHIQASIAAFDASGLAPARQYRERLAPYRQDTSFFSSATCSRCRWLAHETLGSDFVAAR